MRLWMLLLLVSLVNAEVTTTTTEVTVKEGKISDTKEKRASADEASVKNADYERYSDEGIRLQQRTQIGSIHSPSSASSTPTKDQISYILQHQPQLAYAAGPAAPHVTYVPLRSLLGAQPQPAYSPEQQHQTGGTTFSIQYVPASSIYRSAGNSQKYELVSKTQQTPSKAPNPSTTQNSLVYVTPGQGNPYLYAQPPAQTYLQQQQYVHPTPYAASAPQHSAQSSGGIVYTLQPVVMTFALPGSSPAAHNPLLSVFGGGVRAATSPPLVYYPYTSPGVHQAASTVPYAAQRHQLAYVFPSSPYVSPASHRLHQQAVTPRTVAGGNTYASVPQSESPAFRVRSQVPHFQQVKG